MNFKTLSENKTFLCETPTARFRSYKLFYRVTPPVGRGNKLLPKHRGPFQVMDKHWESSRQKVCRKRQKWQKRRIFLAFLYCTTVILSTLPKTTKNWVCRLSVLSLLTITLTWVKLNLSWDKLKSYVMTVIMMMRWWL